MLSDNVQRYLQAYRIWRSLGYVDGSEYRAVTEAINATTREEFITAVWEVKKIEGQEDHEKIRYYNEMANTGFTYTPPGEAQ